jgi:hypothetical protein
MEVDGGRAVSREVFLPSKANDVKSFIFMAQRVVRCLHVSGRRCQGEFSQEANFV